MVYHITTLIYDFSNIRLPESHSVIQAGLSNTDTGVHMYLILCRHSLSLYGIIVAWHAQHYSVELGFTFDIPHGPSTYAVTNMQIFANTPVDDEDCHFLQGYLDSDMPRLCEDSLLSGSNKRVNIFHQLFAVPRLRFFLGDICWHFPNDLQFNK